MKALNNIFRFNMNGIPTFVGMGLILLSTTVFASQNYWLPVQSPTTTELFRCSFPDSLNMWAAGDSAVIVHTSDGGISWVVQKSSLPLNYRFSDIYFINQRLGWGIAFDVRYGNSALIKTTNGGNNWINTNNIDTNLYTVYFIDSLTGFVGETYGGAIYKTTNSGLNWVKCNIEPDTFTYFPKNRFKFYDNQNGIAVGGARDAGGPVWKTTNGGQFWFRINNAGEPIFDVAFVGQNTIIGTGGDFDYGVSVEISRDNGITWHNFYFGYICVGQAVAPRTPAEIWVASASCTGWEVSFDSSNTWDTIRIGNNIAINDTKFCDQYHGWAVCSGGKLFKFNRDMIGIKNIQKDFPAAFQLFQNFPNPFNPTTKIKYNVTSNVKSETSNVKLIIYDILGREVASLVNDKLSTGNYEVTFDGSAYATGVYFYQLIADGNIIDTKKMVIVK